MAGRPWSPGVVALGVLVAVLGAARAVQGQTVADRNTGLGFAAAGAAIAFMGIIGIVVNRRSNGR